MGKSKAISETEENREYAAREAVRTLIRWAGDNPDRPGMEETPARVLAFYREFFRGYEKNAPVAAGIASDVRYKDFILVRDIRIASFCEHHMLSATGTAHIAYIPGEKIAGLGSLARIATLRARRFTTQEAITNDIIDDIETACSPQGSAIFIEMTHGCMSLRNPQQNGASVITTKFSGVFLENMNIQGQFLTLLGKIADQSA